MADMRLPKNVTTRPLVRVFKEWTNELRAYEQLDQCFLLVKSKETSLRRREDFTS